MASEFTDIQLDAQRDGNGFGDFRVDVEDVSQGTVEGFRPGLEPILCFDQLGRDPETFVFLSDTAFEQVFDAQGCADVVGCMAGVPEDK